MKWKLIKRKYSCTKKKKCFASVAVLVAAGLLALTGCGEGGDLAGKAAYASSLDRDLDAIDAKLDSEINELEDKDAVYDISGDYSKLDIQLDVSDLTVRTGETAMLEIHLGNWYKIEDVIQDDTLYLTEKNDGSFWRKWIQFGEVDNSVILTLPEQTVKELTISTNVADVSVSDVNIRNISVELDMGDLSMENCESANLEIVDDYGDVTLTGVTGSVDANLDMGDLLIEDCEGAQFAIVDNYGDIVANDVTGNLTVEMDNGNFSITGGSGDYLDVSNGYGDVTASGITYSALDVFCASGEVVLEKTEADLLNLENDYGDITLELAGEQGDFDYDIVNDYGDINIAGNTVGDDGSKFLFANDAGKSLAAKLEMGDMNVTFYDFTVSE